MIEPRIRTAIEIKNWDAFFKHDDGKWYPARDLCLGRFVLLHRLKCAWAVFTGKYDCLNWMDN